MKAVTENQGLNYYNMLAVCSGNEQAPEADGRRHKKRFFTCDKKREDATLKVNPMDQATIDTIYYSSDGAIRLHNCITQLRLWEQESDPKTPYIGIAIWWLKKQIQILSKA